MEAVRAATAADAEAVAELAVDLLAAVRAGRGGAELLVDRAVPEGPGTVAVASTVDADGVAGLLDDEARHLVVGTLDGIVIGFGLCRRGVPDPAGRGVLEACYVEPAGRGVGVGRALLEAMLDWLSRQGCTGVDGVALPGDRGAKNFYEAAGFKARLLTMHRPLA